MLVTGASRNTSSGHPARAAALDCLSTSGPLWEAKAWRHLERANNRAAVVESSIGPDSPSKGFKLLLVTVESFLVQLKGVEQNADLIDNLGLESAFDTKLPGLYPFHAVLEPDLACLEVFNARLKPRLTRLQPSNARLEPGLAFCKLPNPVLKPGLPLFEPCDPHLEPSLTFRELPEARLKLSLALRELSEARLKLGLTFCKLPKPRLERSLSLFKTCEPRLKPGLSFL